MKIKEFDNELEALLKIREAMKLTKHGLVDDYLKSSEGLLLDYLKCGKINYDE